MRLRPARPRVSSPSLAVWDRFRPGESGLTTDQDNSVAPAPASQDRPAAGGATGMYPSRLTNVTDRPPSTVDNRSRSVPGDQAGAHDLHRAL
jgi:hypothetical protein